MCIRGDMAVEDGAAKELDFHRQEVLAHSKALRIVAVDVRCQCPPIKVILGSVTMKSIS